MQLNVVPLITYCSAFSLNMYYWKEVDKKVQYLIYR